MERDMDLVRQVLGEIEGFSGHPHSLRNVELDDVDGPMIDYHIVILADAGLVTWAAVDQVAPMDDRRGFEGLRLTWAGHEFFDNAKNEGIWSQAKEVIRDRNIKAASFGIWTNILTTLIEKGLSI
jgi:hypothetical protein